MARNGEDRPRRPAQPTAKQLQRRVSKLEKRLEAAVDREQRRTAQLDRAHARRLERQAALDEARVALASTADQSEPPAAAGAAGEPAAGETTPAADQGGDGSIGEGAAPSAYCLREKRTVTMLTPTPVTLGNGRHAVSGTCPSCGASLFKLVSSGVEVAEPSDTRPA